MDKSFTLQASFNTTAETLYKAWLNSEAHSNMTGGEAECSAEVHGAFTAWDGYISGTNDSLTENQRIVQNWRTTEFEENDEDSTLIIEIADTKEGCDITLTHTNIPEGNSNYKQGWIEHYLEPMKIYFNS